MTHMTHMTQGSQRNNLPPTPAVPSSLRESLLCPQLSAPRSLAGWGGNTGSSQGDAGYTPAEESEVITRKSFFSCPSSNFCLRLIPCAVMFVVTCLTGTYGLLKPSF